MGCGQLIRRYPQTFVDLVTLLHERIDIVGIVAPEFVRLGEILLGTARLQKNSVKFVSGQTSAMWVRDFSPIGALKRNGERAFLKFQHNHMRNRDDLVAGEVFRSQLSGRFREIPLNLEGGNLLTNGAGFGISSKTIITQNSARMTHSEIGDILDRKAGVRQWACATPLNAERTGHIDLLATFLNPNLVAIAEANPDDDPNNTAILNDLAGALQGLRTGAGEMNVVRLPMPYSGDTHFRSFNNVIFANGLVVIPAYPGTDAKLTLRTKDHFREWMPDWEIAMVDCDEIATKGGSLHCLTMNVPLASRSVARSDSLEAPAVDPILPR